MKDLDLMKLFNSMKENEINELVIKEGSRLYEIRRGGIKHNIISETNRHMQNIPHVNTVIPHSAHPQQQMPVSVANTEQTKETPSKETRSDLYELKSPLVGTFYASPKPEAPAFVAVGDKVKKGQTLCIIEAMKNFNEIECEVDGIVEEVCVKNTDLIEFGKVLFKIKL
jgi:acetyl-CoA carboxylase biotin carboxyl carrier protein